MNCEFSESEFVRQQSGVKRMKNIENILHSDLTFHQLVAGSNPARPTNNQRVCGDPLLALFPSPTLYTAVAAGTL